MAYHLVKNPTWASGAGTPPKYTFHLDVYVDVVSVSGPTATISIKGTYGVTNYSSNPSNVQKASDFAILTPGDADAWNYDFTPGQEYYEASLPVIPNAPSSVSDKVLIEFRGDTWRSDPSRPGNRSSLWLNGSGTVLDQLYTGGTTGDTRTFNIDTTFTIDVSDRGDTPILAYVSSGWSAGPVYEWLDHEVLVSWIDLDYIPWAINDGDGRWLSHNRTGGTLKIYNGSSWSNNLRTVNGGVGTGDPPSIFDGNEWKNGRRIGLE